MLNRTSLPPPRRGRHRPGARRWHGRRSALGAGRPQLVRLLRSPLAERSADQRHRLQRAVQLQPLRPVPRRVLRVERPRHAGRRSGEDHLRVRGKPIGVRRRRIRRCCGQLATAVEASSDDADATAFGGQNLIATVESRVVASGDEAGRAVDSGFADYSNSIGQAWVVRALATSPTSTAKLTSATDYLLKQQCATGAFRTNMFAVAVADDPTTTEPWEDETVLPVDRECGDTTTADDDQITIDATAFGIQALLSAKDAGVANLQDDIDAAVSWLLKQQAANGSFVNDDNANTNTTGLAAVTLKAVGADRRGRQRRVVDRLAPGHRRDRRGHGARQRARRYRLRPGCTRRRQDDWHPGQPA
ncbi:prenyltransferase/squalene oxidase repeat-containing protein [Aeromicrobium sp. UC242_57]|uniref:prenyltransferase/squalene oxidase repeat-containing protein n=1 Tax=Aeromicrobium sp. UC242_57 TaxID=3374624 RepID=UPI0037A7307C